MLSVDQVLPFVRQDDPLVADLAMHYLERVRWPSRLTGQFVLEVVRAGREKLKRWLSSFKPSGELLAYAIEALREGEVGKKEEFWPYHVIAEADDALFTPEVVAQVKRLRLDDGWVQESTRWRLEMMNWPTERLESRFLKACEEANESEKAQSELYEIRALVDRLAQRPEADDWAVRQLEHFYGEGWWMEIFLFSLLAEGGRRPEQVLPRAIERFLEVHWEENESLSGDTARAIGELAREQDLPALASLWERSNEDHRSQVAETVSHLRVPGADELLLRCGRETGDEDTRTFAAMGLCEMVTDDPEAVEFVRDLTEREAFAVDHCDLEELAIPLGIMLGKPFAEEARWRERLDEQGNRMERRQRVWSEKYPDLVKLGELIEQRAETQRYERALRLENAQLRAELGIPPGAALPEVSSRKVGRNDPCPCGSGKKYKKCCLGKD
jgi:hypothetical protein